ncbi:MAG: MaoC family dehydratase [Acidobacteria bacterium]|nr:MAG: MaoC family dehydratase [Acidobacteriota bacterium]
MADRPADAADLAFEDIVVGQEASFARTIEDADVRAFATLSGDRNPLHMDAAYAATTQFGGRVVHGMLVASFFSTLVGMCLPGRRALFLSQQLRFPNPVRIGDRLTFKGRVRKKTDAVRLLDIDVTAVGDDGEMKVNGTLQVAVLP